MCARGRPGRRRRRCPRLALLGRGQRAEAAAAGRCEDRVGALVDLVQGQLLALRLVDEVLRVAGEDLDARLLLLRARLVAGEERDDGRNGLSADEADGARLVLERGGDAGEVPGLGLGEEDAAGVLRLALERGPRVVDDRELRVREPLGDRCELVAHQEADPEDEVVALACRRGQVRDVVPGRLRDEDAALDAELGLGPLEALVRQIVEALVVEAADVGDDRDLDGVASALLDCAEPTEATARPATSASAAPTVHLRIATCPPWDSW